MANFLKSLFIKGVEVDTAGATTGNVLSYNGTKFAPAAPGSGSLALDDLSDAVISSPEEFQSLVYNGTNWVNQHASTVTYVRNAESTTLTTGTVVYLFGATGDHASVKRADMSSDTTSSKTVGVVAANITASNNGPVVTRGYVDGIDLSVGYAAGDILWLGDDGAFTKTKATAPDHLVFVGVVVRATNNGIIYVACQNGYELDELHNVSLPSPNSGEFLKYNGSVWVADTIDLGTDTTGNYMSGISGTSPVSVSHTPAEGSSATVSLASGYGDTQNPYDSKTANYFLASPNGSAGAPTFRAIVAADIPTLNQSTTGNAATATTLQTSRNINGVAFNGSADITVTAAAGTLTGTTLASGVTASSLTSVGTITSGTWSGSFGAVSGANLTNLNASNLSSGTVASARVSGGYTGITAVGTLTTTLTVDTVNSPAITLGDWSVTNAYSGVTGTTGYLLLGHASDTSVYLRATGAAAVVNLGGNSTSTLSVGNSTSTFNGVVNLSYGSLGAGAGTESTGWKFYGTTTNMDSLDLRVIRRAASPTDWTTSYYRIQRLVDVTRQGFIQFGSSSGTYSGVELGYGSTAYLSLNGTTGIINVDLPITSTQSFSATNSGNQNNYVKLGTGSTDSNATLFGYTAYANVRTTCGYNVGISWISTGSASPSGFTPNAHAVFLAAGGTVSGDIRSNANNATSYNTSSDYRLKRDVVDIEDGIARIRMLKPKRFKFIDDPADTVFDGFLAHEVEDIVPVAVSGAKDAVGENGHPMYQQIDTSWMVALLAAGIKDLDAKVLELQARIAVLESN